MKNVVKCYKDFFGYFNDLKTHCEIIHLIGTHFNFWYCFIFFLTLKVYNSVDIRSTMAKESVIYGNTSKEFVAIMKNINKNSNILQISSAPGITSMHSNFNFKLFFSFEVLRTLL